jgi:MYXO-CTERM domain-containing protein
VARHIFAALLLLIAASARAETPPYDARIPYDQGSDLGPPPPVLSLPPGMTFEEGNSGEREVKLTIRLVPAATQPVTVDWWAQAEVAATDKGDFRAVDPGLLTFAPGETEKTVVVMIAGDTTPELDERIVVEIGQQNGAVISQPTSLITIRNDDGPLPDAGPPDAGPPDARPADAQALPDLQGFSEDAYRFVVDVAPDVTVPPDLAPTTPAPDATVAGDATVAPGKGGGCDCRMGGGGGSWVGALPLLVALVWRRRRR